MKLQNMTNRWKQQTVWAGRSANIR